VLAIADGEESSLARMKIASAASVRCSNCMGRKRMTRGLTTDENRGGGMAKR
jgi:hypothetical protein